MKKSLLAILVLAVALGIIFFWSKEVQAPSDWQTYTWEKGGISFKYPADYAVKKDYYQTPAQQQEGLPAEEISLLIYPAGNKSTITNTINVGGRQVDCRAQDFLTRCKEVTNLPVYTETKDPNVLAVYDQMIPTFKFTK